MSATNPINSVESAEFVQYRNDQYAAAAQGVEPVPTKAEQWREKQEAAGVRPEAGFPFICLCCGTRARRRPFMHVCEECFDLLEGER